MTERFDTIVIGLGALGSATAWDLARRGRSVLGLERFELGHARRQSGAVRLVDEQEGSGASEVSVVVQRYRLRQSDADAPDRVERQRIGSRPSL